MIVACRACELLFEVDESTSYRCPQCDRALVPHEPQSEVVPVTSDIFEEPSVDRTQLLDVPLDSSHGPSVSDSVDDWARFGSSASVSIDSTRVLSPPKQIRVGSLDRTQVLDSVDDALDSYLTSTVHSPQMKSSAPLGTPNETDYRSEKDLWTSARRLGDESAQEPSVHLAGHSDIGSASQSSRRSRIPRSRLADNAPSGRRIASTDSRAAPPPFKASRKSGAKARPSVVSLDSETQDSARRTGPVQPRRSLDQASPKPLNLVDEPRTKPERISNRQRNAPTPLNGPDEPGPKAENTSERQSRGPKKKTREKASNRTIIEAPPFDGPDAIDELIDSHRKSLDHKLEADDSPKSESSSRFGPLIWTIASLVLLAITAIVLRKSPDTENQTKQQSAQTVAKNQINRALADLKINPIPLKGVDAANGVSFIALGKEGAQTSLGPIVGLTSLTIPAARVSTDSGGSWLESVRGALFSSKIKRDRMAIALDRNGRARQLGLLGQSIQRAGFRQALLVVERVEDGKLGLVPFYAGKKATPSAGEVVVRIGADGMYTSVIARDGSLLAPDMAPVKRRSNGELDLDAIDKQLDLLSRRFPLIRAATAYVDPTLNIQTLVGLMHRLRHGENKERFTSIRLVAE